MKRPIYKIGDIRIGDEVLFNDVVQVEHNLFWKVIKKLSHNRLIVEIREMGYAEKFIVSVKDVINLHRNSLAY